MGLWDQNGVSSARESSGGQRRNRSKGCTIWTTYHDWCSRTCSHGTCENAAGNRDERDVDKAETRLEYCYSRRHPQCLQTFLYTFSIISAIAEWWSILKAIVFAMARDHSMLGSMVTTRDANCKNQVIHPYRAGGRVSKASKHLQSSSQRLFSARQFCKPFGIQSFGYPEDLER